jgi:hypothetical protein
VAVYIGTATPSAYYLGSSAVSKIYLGSTQVCPSTAGATFSTFNTAWNNIAFTGSGTSASPYYEASFSASPNADGAQATVVSAGTVRVTASTLHCDFDFKIYKNGSAAATYPDNSGGNGFDGAVNATITVASGDTIRLGSTGDNLSFSALNVWWQ